MKNLLMNEGYSSKKLYTHADGTYIFHKKKSFIDLCCGGGSLLLGHNHHTFKKALNKISKEKISMLSSPNEQANYFAKQISKVLSQFNKFIFCNSGAEANLKALRICRAITKKNKIALVTGSWHGSIDQCLYKPNIKLNRAIPLSHGLDQNYKKKIIFIPYNDFKKTKTILDNNLNDIACVMCEPIQGGLPLNESVKYLKELDRYCRNKNIIFLLDEIISGLRFERGSLQQMHDIKSDISTFGKAFGGGMPLGFIALSNKVTRIVEKNNLNIIYGGTFSGNSLTSYVGINFLKYFQSNKKKIIKKINDLTKQFSDELNHFIIKNDLPLKVYYFQSMARIVFTDVDIQNRTQRDFLEKNKSTKIIQMIEYLEKVNIKYPSNGVLLFNYAMTKKDLTYLIKNMKIVILKLF